MTDLLMKGTKGRDASPRTHQLKNVAVDKAPAGIGKTGTGTPLNKGVPAEAKTGHSPGAVIDPAMFNVDLHAVRQFSHYWEGKRSGPDWLHRRIEAAEAQRYETAAGPMLEQSLPRRRKL